MANLRIIHDNAADRATLVPSQVVAGMGATNLTSNIKSRVCRATSTYLGINAQWATPEPVNAVAMVFTNVSPTAIMRVRVTTEVSTTNYCLYSEQLQTANWAKSGGSIAQDTIVAPNGATTADRLTSSSGDGYVVQTINGLPTGVSMVASVWLKSTVPRLVYLYFGSGVNPVSVTTSWQRYYVNCSPLTSSQSAFQISGNGQLQNGAILDIWGAQVETGTMPTSYYPTGSVSATRPTGFINSFQSYQYDSGNVSAVLAEPPRLRGWTAAQQASAYAYGGGTNIRHWIPTTINATGVLVEVGDDRNLQGYVEASRLIIGQYWSPTDVGAAEGSTMTVGDTSKQFRTDAGDQYTDTGTRFRKQSISLPSINSNDRAKFWEILWGSGMSNPIYISMYPANADPKLEQAYEIYGKLISMPIMGTPYFNRNSATVEIEEV